MAGHEFVNDEGEKFMLNVRRYHIKPILISLNKANHGTRRIGVHDYKLITEEIDFSKELVELDTLEDYQKVFEAAPNSSETKEVILTLPGN